MSDRDAFAIAALSGLSCVAPWVVLEQAYVAAKLAAAAYRVADAMLVERAKVMNGDNAIRDLLPYVQHKPGCAMVYTTGWGKELAEKTGCSCGLDEAMK